MAVPAVASPTSARGAQRANCWGPSSNRTAPRPQALAAPLPAGTIWGRKPAPSSSGANCWGLGKDPRATNTVKDCPTKAAGRSPLGPWGRAPSSRSRLRRASGARLPGNSNSRRWPCSQAGHGGKALNPSIIGLPGAVARTRWPRRPLAVSGSRTATRRQRGRPIRAHSQGSHSLPLQWW